jgi:hypothetical protein
MMCPLITNVVVEIVHGLRPRSIGSINSFAQDPWLMTVDRDECQKVRGYTRVCPNHRQLKQHTYAWIELNLRSG